MVELLEQLRQHTGQPEWDKISEGDYFLMLDPKWPGSLTLLDTLREERIPYELRDTNRGKMLRLQPEAVRTILEGQEWLRFPEDQGSLPFEEAGRSIDSIEPQDRLLGSAAKAPPRAPAK